MVIYIEYLIIDNIVMDCLIFYLMKVSFNINYTKLRLIIALVLGVLCAFLMPYLLNFSELLILYRIIFSVIIILTLTKFTSIKKLFIHLVVFWLYTFLFCGIIMGFLNIFNIEYCVGSVILYNSQVPMGFILILCIANVWLIKNIIIAIKDQIKTSNYLYKIKLIDGGKEVMALGFLDSGNKVEIDGRGVNIISINLFQKLHNDISIDRLILGKVDKFNLKNISYIDISGIGGGSKYLTFTIDKLLIEKNVYENVNIAVALKNFENFDCILSGEYVGGVI